MNVVSPQKVSKITTDIKNAKTKLNRTMLSQVPELQKQAQEIQVQMRNATGSEKAVLRAQLDYVNKKIQAARSGVPIREAKQGLDAIKSSWIDKISSKGHKKAEVSKFIKDQVKELEDKYPEDYKAIVGTLKKILKGKYKVDLEEASQGAVTTGSVGVSTMSTNTGAQVPAAFGSSHIFAPKVAPMVSRYGVVGDKKKKRKKYNEYIENYGKHI